MSDIYEVNRQKFIFDLTYIPEDIRRFQKLNKKLTKAEKMVSAFLQDCVRLKYVKTVKTQQLMKMGADDKFIMADFFLMNPDLIIEVDGPEHVAWKDAWRDKRIKQLFNYNVVRVTNDDVILRNDETREKLLTAIANQMGIKPYTIVAHYWSTKNV